MKKFKCNSCGKHKDMKSLWGYVGCYEQNKKNSYSEKPICNECHEEYFTPVDINDVKEKLKCMLS